VTDIQTLQADPRCLFAVSHSGGKDSQATLIEVLRWVPSHRVIVIYADLGEVAWDGAKEHARAQAEAAGCAFYVAEAIYKDGRDKTFLNKVEDRFATRPDAPSFPSPNNRWCTSELKTGPIQKVIRTYMKARGLTKVVDCQGLRAAESDHRKGLSPFVYENENRNAKGEPKSGLCGAGRHVWTWLPIHAQSTSWVFETIATAGQSPHWAYAAGNERLSCVFCIFGKASDLRNGAKHRPELFAKYVELETRTGSTLSPSGKPLADLVGDAINLAA
jgi:3'-phosphoadenosine 5'-phosphosulfate sulfotransferase (PAPS reductase)/FAD synthetase